ncbi:unnamed protein product [Sphacelaria rigidula]
MLHGTVGMPSAIGKKLQTIRELLKLGADPNSRDIHGITPLMRAAQDLKFGAKTAQVLLEAGADMSIIEPATNQTAMGGAARLGNHEVVQLLLDAGGLTTYEADGWTPLLFASLEGHEKVVQRLVDAGADKEVMVDDRTPLMLAAQHDSVNVVRVLVKAGARINAKAGDGRTALICAVENGRAATVKILCEAGADPNGDLHGHTALMICADLGHVEAERVLLKAGADVNAGPPGCSPLFKACREQHATIARDLLRAGARSVDKEMNGLSALHIAAGRSFPEVARVCLEEGCLETARTNRGETPACTIGRQVNGPFVKTTPTTKEHARLRVLLARGPAFRARSYLWPHTRPKRPAEVAGSNDERVAVKHKLMPLPVAMSALRYRRKGGRSTSFVGMLSRYSVKPGQEPECNCHLCTATRL